MNKLAYEESTQRQAKHCSIFNVDKRVLSDLLSEHALSADSHFANNIRFHLTAESPLPEYIQHRLLIVILERLTPNVDHALTIAAVDWLTSRWQLWYESHSKKRKELYEYRKTARFDREEDDERVEMEDDEMPDMEMVEVKYGLPYNTKSSFRSVNCCQTSQSSLLMRLAIRLIWDRRMTL